MYISATKQSKDQQKQDIIINTCIKHIRQEETHIYIYIYKIIVHVIKKRTTARADPQPPLQPTHRQKKTFRPLLVLR